MDESEQTKSKSISDKLKLIEIDQLHSAILQFSKNTIQLKTICCSFLIALIAVILNITGNKFDSAIIWCSLIVVFCFWIIDSYSYYYQRKIRIKMTELINDLRKNEFISDGFGLPLNKGEKPSQIKALFNFSHIFYYLAFFAIILLFILHIKKVIE